MYHNRPIEQNLSDKFNFELILKLNSAKKYADLRCNCVRAIFNPVKVNPFFKDNCGYYT